MLPLRFFAMAFLVFWIVVDMFGTLWANKDGKLYEHKVFCGVECLCCSLLSVSNLPTSTFLFFPLLSPTFSEWCGGVAAIARGARIADGYVSKCQSLADQQGPRFLINPVDLLGIYDKLPKFKMV